MINANSFHVSGIIVDVTKEKVGSLILWIEQDVCVKKERNINCKTIFPIFISKDLIGNTEERFLVGDEILIENGLVYAKNGQIRIKVESLSQIKKVNDVSALFLGSENPEEKFI